jgi:hypothetical protein
MDRRNKQRTSINNRVDKYKFDTTENILISHQMMLNESKASLGSIHNTLLTLSNEIKLLKQKIEKIESQSE